MLTPSLCKERIRSFNALVRRTMEDEVKDFYKMIGRRTKKSVTFSDLGEDYEDCLPELEMDEFNSLFDPFTVLGCPVDVRDEYLHFALKQLDDLRRKVILMSYWLEMNDREIAEALGYKRRNVNRIKNSAYEKLRKSLEGNGYENGGE